MMYRTERKNAWYGEPGEVQKGHLAEDVEGREPTKRVAAVRL